jgi:tRNA threonylcarbamoyladenosine biosynthesis protein TsaB
VSYILNIETATKNCSVAIAKGGQVLVARDIATEGYSHAEKLHVFIEESLRESNIKFTDLSAIAVSKGPGSYTGLRIGVSAAKGFCYALGIPLISIDTLEVLARQLEVSEGLIIPMIDARRMEVYSAVFNSQYDKINAVTAEIISADSYSGETQKMHIVGDCQEKIKTALSGENFIYHDNIMFPSAKQMASLSHAKFRNDDFEDVAYFEPFYLKDFMVGHK